MANVKISQLTGASSVVDANEFEINEAGTSKKVTGAQISTKVRADITSSDVQGAGALMDSELTALADVKAIDQGVSTGDSPQFTGINVGHASDTTLTRVSAGKLAVEGVEITANSTTQTLTNKTLTSPTLTSPTVNVTSDATGDLYYRTAGGAFARLAIGSTDEVLTVSSGLPSWEEASSGSSSLGAVGTTMVLYQSTTGTSNTSVTADSTYAGSGLVYTTSSSQNGFATIQMTGTAAPTGTAVSGTWRALQSGQARLYTSGIGANTKYYPALYVRTV
jgi:hypothetical protein